MGSSGRDDENLFHTKPPGFKASFGCGKGAREFL